MKWILLVAATSCVSAPGARTVPKTRVTIVPEHVGTCGVEAARPDDHIADRDLNSDGVAEWVRAARAGCDARGNCIWQIAHSDGACMRVIGQVVARALEQQHDAAAEFAPVRAAFQLSGDRFLFTTYRFDGSEYVPGETLLCRRTDGTTVTCFPH